jgi:hypothetical protein
VSGGFNYTPGPDNSSGFNDLHMGNAVSDFPYNGTTVGVSHDDVVLSRVGGGTFSISQFDFAGWPSAELPFRVVGNLFGGGQLFGSFTPDGVSDGLGGAADFQTFIFGLQWTNLVSVTWVHNGGNQGLFGLDNIVVDQEAPVPEPSTMLLLGTGLSAAARRRRKQS